MVLVVILLAFLLFAKPVLASPFINEFMAHPSSGNTEWVEFYNPDSLDLTSYFIDDDTSFASDSGSSSKKSLATTTTGIYPSIDLSSMLNNSGDFVVLFDSSGNIIDQYQYTSDPGTDTTIGRSPDGGSWIILSSASKGSANGGASSPSPSPSNSSSTFSISSVPSEINSDQVFSASVNINLSSNPNSKFYLKGAFKKADSSNYFGLTKVGSSWISNGNSYSNQYQITTDSSGNWSGTLEIQPDVLDSGYDGSGDYLFKVGRYSDSGSGPTWSNEVSIKMNAKEIESGGEVINLSGIGTVKDKKVLGENIKTEDLPKEVYSLEKYRKLASSSASLEVTPSAEVKSEKSINPLSIIGTLLILGGLSATIITYAVRKLQPPAD